jgi:hypothetical protein
MKTKIFLRAGLDRQAGDLPSGKSPEATERPTGLNRPPNTGHTGPCFGMHRDGGILFKRKRLCVNLVHEDERNSMRSFAFYRKRNPCAPVSPGARFLGDFTRTYGGCDHATGQASFEAETHNQSRRRESAGCRRTEFFAGGWCIRIHDAHRRHPTI